MRVNPKEYFDEAKNAIGLIYRDQTHAIGRDIHKRDPLARLLHVIGVLGLILLTSATVWAARKYTLDGRLGSTWLTVRWITGIVGLVGIAAVMTYSGRKQVYRHRAGPLRYWLLAHVYLGSIAGVLLLLHGGRSSGGLLTSMLMVSFDLVILSGLFGIACYLIVPRIMTSIEGDPLLFEDLKARREELRETLALIKKGGPFPHARDGVAFGNRENLLPKHDRGYYREYTVKTPGARDRGARRIVAGAGGEYFYTDDHYRSFRRIRE